MSYTEKELQAFAEKHLKGAVELYKLPIDASTRVYYRAIKAGDKDSAIVMNSSKELETIEPFQRIAEYLRAQGLHAPEVLAVEPERGLMLLEDLGDMHLIKYVEQNPENELETYHLAIDGLIKLYQMPPAPSLPMQDLNLLQRGSQVFIDYWLARYLQGQQLTDAAAELRELLSGYYQDLPQLQQVTVLRDYHAENLMLVPQSTGLWRLGVIDFQDAVVGSPVYDLMSILEDGRRIVPGSVAESCIDYYITHTGVNAEELRYAYLILGLQRNLRIIGRFSQLIYSEKKMKYAQFMDRKRSFVQKRLELVEFSALQRWFAKHQLVILG